MEFCSDIFLLPLGVPFTIDSIDIDSDTYLKNPRPDPPPREFIPNIIPKSPDFSYYELLLNKLEFNNNNNNNESVIKNNISNLSQSVNNNSDPAPNPPSRQPLEPIFESQESDEML